MNLSYKTLNSINDLDTNTKYNDGDIVYVNDTRTIYMYYNKSFTELIIENPDDYIEDTENKSFDYSKVYDEYLTYIFIYFLYILKGMGYDYNNDSSIMDIINNKIMYSTVPEDISYVKFDDDYNGITIGGTHLDLGNKIINVNNYLDDINFMSNILYDLSPDPFDENIIKFNKLINYIKEKYL